MQSHWFTVLCNLVAIPYVTVILAPLSLSSLPFLFFIQTIGPWLIAFGCMVVFIHCGGFLSLLGTGHWMIWVHPINSVYLCFFCI